MSSLRFCEFLAIPIQIEGSAASPSIHQPSDVQQRLKFKRSSKSRAGHVPLGLTPSSNTVQTPAPGADRSVQIQGLALDWLPCARREFKYGLNPAIFQVF